MKPSDIWKIADPIRRLKYLERHQSMLKDTKVSKREQPELRASNEKPVKLMPPKTYSYRSKKLDNMLKKRKEIRYVAKKRMGMTKKIK